MSVSDTRALNILFEDDWLIVIDKPAGLLSQPGIAVHDSVHTRVLAARSAATGPVLVHRLDMDTSGVMVLAKTRDAHRNLQQQFEKRRVAKRYVALVTGPLPGLGGIIDLPLRLDIDNRPRQIVCRANGKAAVTHWRASNDTGADTGTDSSIEMSTEAGTGVGTDAGSERRVVLFPVTGRTHQLRVHLADAQGLALPVVGDRLYGARDDAQPSGATGGPLPPRPADSDTRMMLHAAALSFFHPVNHEPLRVAAPVPF